MIYLKKAIASDDLFGWIFANFTEKSRNELIVNEFSSSFLDAITHICKQRSSLFRQMGTLKLIMVRKKNRSTIVSNFTADQMCRKSIRLVSFVALDERK